MNHLDLFSGIGGFALAARWAMVDTIQFVEKDNFCKKVLQKNFPNIPIHDDIKDFNFYGKIDILTGGFPCQPFSVAGKRKGFEDERYLWPEMLRIIKQCKPRFIIAENVPGIISVLDSILKDLEEEKYSVQSYLIPASLIGAPHKRERLWIIANSNGERCNHRVDFRKERQLQNNIQRHIKKIQSEWPQFFPKSWQTFNAQDWLTYTDGEPSIETNSKSESLSDQRNSRVGYSRQNRRFAPKFNWEKDKPPIPGVDDGLSHVVDRNKSLGNAIVPQIAYIFLKIIQVTELIKI